MTDTLDDTELDFDDIEYGGDDNLDDLNEDQLIIYEWIKGFKRKTDNYGKEKYRVKDIEDDIRFADKSPDFKERLRIERLKCQNDYYEYAIYELYIKIEEIKERYAIFSSVFKELFIP